jgi:hypothetical protein
MQVALSFGSEGVSVPFGPVKTSKFVSGSLSRYHLINTLSLFINGKFNANSTPLVFVDKFISMCMALPSVGGNLKYNIDCIGISIPNKLCICNTVFVLHGITDFDMGSKTLINFLES